MLKDWYNDINGCN